MSTQLQTEPDALWKQRYRAPRTYAWPARTNAGRGMAISNRTGVYQLYAWDPASGELRQLTDRPTGKAGGVIDPQGSFVYYHDDKAGDEIGHWVRVPWDAGTATPNWGLCVRSVDIIAASVPSVEKNGPEARSAER